MSKLPNIHHDPVSKEIVQKKRQIIRTFEAKFNAQRKWYDRFADLMTGTFGTFWFFALNGLWFFAWILWNSPLFPFLPKFDPYPYGFLTMMVSLEAIFLSIIVLISQNRQSKIADMREEIDLNINVRAEREITKILNLVDAIHDHLGLENENDHELTEMKQEIDLEEVEKEIEKDFR